MTDVTGRALQPIQHTVTPATRAADALGAMARGGIDFLPVVEEESGVLLGIVLRQALENACAANGHDPDTCPVLNHLKRDVERRAEDGSPLEPERPGADRRKRPLLRGRSPAPILYVDAAGAPVAYAPPAR